MLCTSSGTFAYSQKRKTKGMSVGAVDGSADKFIKLPPRGHSEDDTSSELLPSMSRLRDDHQGSYRAIESKTDPNFHYIPRPYNVAALQNKSLPSRDRMTILTFILKRFRNFRRGKAISIRSHLASQFPMLYINARRQKWFTANNIQPLLRIAAAP
jgi:hypothetical protein